MTLKREQRLSNSLRFEIMVMIYLNKQMKVAKRFNLATRNQPDICNLIENGNSTHPLTLR